MPSATANSVSAVALAMRARVFSGVDFCGGVKAHRSFFTPSPVRMSSQAREKTKAYVAQSLFFLQNKNQ